MKRTLVLDPATGFARIEAALAAVGWRVADRGSSPLLPGEPEYAVFERPASGHASAARLHYTFNPVCHLRAAEVDTEATDAGTVGALPIVAPETVASWLGDPDEHTVLRGTLAARHLDDPGLLDRVEAHTGHPRPAIAEAARRSAASLRATLATRTPGEDAARQSDARTQALTAIAVLRDQLEPLLRSLARDPDGQVAESLRPRPDDYARAFLPRWTDAARDAYQAVWNDVPRVRSASADVVVRCHLAPAGMLADENELSFHFPGGYRGIAPLLDPHRVWARWTYLRPGASAGQSYDGLVWLDDHWAWFPKPFRVLRELAEGAAG